jgi:hypothetical protein
MKYDNEKLLADNLELSRGQEGLEAQLTMAQKDITELDFLKNEYAKIFVSSCDAMSSWEQLLLPLVRIRVRVKDRVRLRFRVLRVRVRPVMNLTITINPNYPYP